MVNTKIKPLNHVSKCTPWALKINKMCLYHRLKNLIDLLIMP